MTQPAEGGCAATTASFLGEQTTLPLKTPARKPNVGRMPSGRRLTPAERARLVLEDS